MLITPGRVCSLQEPTVLRSLAELAISLLHTLKLAISTDTLHLQDPFWDKGFLAIWEMKAGKGTPFIGTIPSVYSPVEPRALEEINVIQTKLSITTTIID